MHCQCQNCGFSDDAENLPPARDVLLRHSLGDVFSNVECPKCGALCVPIDGNDETESFAMVLAQRSGTGRRPAP